MPPRYGFCPYCGAPISLESWNRDLTEFSWTSCSMPRTRGCLLAVVTDFHGFVIHPYRIRGRYVYVQVRNGYG
ncbi:MAG: hypothetical protein LUO89_11270 [Methanothrix sp.]|nr:hypothetical protein [Methanothrix sp.]